MVSNCHIFSSLSNGSTVMFCFYYINQRLIVLDLKRDGHLALRMVSTYTNDEYQLTAKIGLQINALANVK